MTHTTTLLLCALAGAVAVIAATPAQAQSCPADVADLTSQIDEPQLQARLTEPLDAIVSNAGGLKAAVTQWEQKLAEAQAERAELPSDAPPGLTRAFDELILILDRQLDGLQCRGG